jgi:thymidylate synthase ThyX
MSIKAEIIADSISPKGYRLTTFILEFPRFILAELNTHRALSKNAASSRAIPIEKMIQHVLDNPAMPTWWGKNQSGMQAKEELDATEKTFEVNGILGAYNTTPRQFCQDEWLRARDAAIESARAMSAAGLHKQIANRLLEPWFNIRVILTGTEFGNFFALRAHPDAQPEFQELAYKMLEEYNKSVPIPKKKGQWHIPFGDKMDEERLNVYGASIEEIKIKIAVARCARISYFNYEGKDDYEKDIATCDKLFGSVPRHLSPAEHVAMVTDTYEMYGNFHDWKQYRKFFEDERLADSRINKK